MRSVTRTVGPAVSSVTPNLTSRTITDRWISVKQGKCAQTVMLLQLYLSLYISVFT